MADTTTKTTTETEDLTLEGILKEKKDKAKRATLETLAAYQQATDTAVFNAEGVLRNIKDKAEVRTKAIKDLADKLDTLSPDEIIAEVKKVQNLPLA